MNKDQYQAASNWVEFPYLICNELEQLHMQVLLNRRLDTFYDFNRLYKK